MMKEFHKMKEPTRKVEALECLLSHLSEDVNKAFLMVRRADNGWIAWNKVNKWYTATPGIALSDRIAAIMRPSQAKKDEEVMHEVEKWIDDVRECRAMGATDLASNFKLTAIRMIAMESIREKMDYEEAQAQDTMTKEERYNMQLDMLTRWAHQKMVNSKDKAKTSSAKMEIGATLGKGA